MAAHHSCTVCDELSKPIIFPPAEPVVLVIEAEDLHRDVRQGCPFCRLIYCAMTAFAPDRSIPVNGVYAELGWPPLWGPLPSDKSPGRPLRLETYFSDDEALALELFCLPGLPTMWPAIGPARAVSHNSSTDQCRQLALEWLQDCKSHHTSQCNSLPSQLPTRVIDVGSEHDVPFLYVTKGKTAEYVALSHCWGGVVPLRTTSDTLKDRTSGIGMHTLPRTFQDAVTITRSLGIKYLWIDSLCIIQDSADDWNREAAMMGSVYCNATVTIAADGAMNSNDGCFRDLSGHKNILALDVPDPSGKQTKVYIRPSSRKELKDDLCHQYFHTGPQSALDSRGWVLQERLLSKRILHYTNIELAWECDTSQSCECRLSAERGNFRHRTIAGHLKKALQRPRQLNLKRIASLHREASFNWAHIVENFTARSLTQPRDRLPALSGMAELRASLTGHEYLCGLWRENIAKWLWWMPAEGCEESRRLEPYYAPSWSWASVTGSISYDPSSAWKGDNSVDQYSVVRIEGVDVVLASTNRFGSAKSGSLRTAGIATPCQVTFQSTSDPRQRGKRVIPSLKRPQLGVRVNSKSVQQRIITWTPDIFYKTDTSNDSLSLEGEDWSFEVNDGSNLILLSMINLIGVDGLVLQPLSGSPDTYRRVGSFSDGAKESPELLEGSVQSITIV